MVERLFLTVPRGCLRFVIVVFPDHTHLLFFTLYEIEYIVLGEDIIIVPSLQRYQSKTTEIHL